MRRKAGQRQLRIGVTRQVAAEQQTLPQDVTPGQAMSQRLPLHVRSAQAPRPPHRMVA